MSIKLARHSPPSRKQILQVRARRCGMCFQSISDACISGIITQMAIPSAHTVTMCQQVTLFTGPSSRTPMTIAIHTAWSMPSIWQKATAVGANAQPAPPSLAKGKGRWGLLIEPQSCSSRSLSSRRCRTHGSRIDFGGTSASAARFSLEPPSSRQVHLDPRRDSRRAH